MKVSEKTYDTLKRLGTALLDPTGREVNNPVPLKTSAALKRPESLQDKIKKIIRTDLAMEAMEQGRESFDEANDFDVLDDFEMPELPSEYILMEEEFIDESKTGTEVADDVEDASKVQEDEPETDGVGEKGQTGEDENPPAG